MLFYSLIQYLRVLNMISDTLYSDAFNLVLKKYLKVDFKRDWIGRLYGIINPIIDINGKLDVNNMIIEIDDDHTNNNEYIKTWVYKQLTLVGTLFKIEKLYDYISLDFKHVGPINGDNYLLVFDLSSRKYFVSWLKRFAIQSILYIIVFLTVYFIFL